MSFAEKLRHSMQKNNSLLCLGLDPDPELMPPVGILEFNKAIIDATSDLVCAYKPNLAFYEALGIEGWEALQQTLKYVPPGIPVIGDAKRSDIGNTARLYAKALFETWGFDAVTVNPYLGYDSLEPFLHYASKGVFILCHTSNPGARDFQTLSCVISGSSSPPLSLFEVVARKAEEWNRLGNVGLVVGATYPEDIQRVRRICPQMTLLIPGIGAQQGDLSVAVRYGVTPSGGKVILSSSRQILYASRDKDFALASRKAAQQLVHQVNSLLRNA